MKNIERINKTAQDLLSMGQRRRKKLLHEALSLCDNLREKAALVLFYVYGPRPAELMKMRKRDFIILHRNDNTRTLKVRLPTVKRGRDREIVLDIEKSAPELDYVVRYLDEIHDPEMYIFYGWHDRTNLNHIFRKIRKRTEGRIDWCPYVLRKFRLSYLFMSGADPSDILIWKGGKSLQSLETYIKTAPLVKFRELRL